jgi:hypothetical protein
MPKYIINYHTVTGRDFKREVEADSINGATVIAMTDNGRWVEEDKYTVYLRTDHIVATEIYKVDDSSGLDEEDPLVY